MTPNFDEFLLGEIVDAIIVKTPEDRVVYWNRGAQDLFGYTSEEAVGRLEGELIIPTDRMEDEGEMLRKVLVAELPTYETTRRKKDGSLVYVDVSSKAIRNREGRVEYILSTSKDVTRLKTLRDAELAAHNEEALRSEQKLLLQSTALATAANAVVITDAKGIILWVNEAFASLTGYSSEEVMGKTPRLLKSGKHDRKFYQNLWATILSGKTWRGNFTNRRKDGSLYHDEHTITPVRSKEGVITHFIAIMNDMTERRRAEQQLTLLDTCVSKLSDVVMITEAELIDEPGPRIVFVNEAFERLTGYTQAETLGRTPRILQGPKTGRRVLAEIRQALIQHQPIRRQLINYRKDGTEYWMDIDIVPIFDAEGKCTHFAAIERDITEARRIDEQLLWKTAMLEAQLNADIDGILIVNSDRQKVLQNRRMVDLWSLPEEWADESDHQRRYDWIIKQVKNPRQFAEKVAYLYDHPDDVSHDEVELLDGRFFDRYTAPVRGQDGKNFGRIWSFRDVTERKKAVEQIAEQADFLDKARDAIIVRDLEGKVLFWNKGAERNYGWTRQEVVGRSILEIIHTDPKKFEEINRLTISRGEWNGELHHVTKDRRELTIEVHATLIRDNEGRPKSVLSINSDITEKKLIEAQFLRAQRMESIGTLAGGIAHDLNNILAPIMMSIDVLKTTAGDPQTKQILETIRSSAKRGADIVRQVLSFARGLEGERIEIHPKHLLKDLERIIKDTFPKDIRLEFSIPKDTWTILGDPTQVHQILLNLCVNARDAMPNGGSLAISVENCVLDEHYAAMNMQAKSGRYVSITVTDSGTGIPPEIHGKIFEPFFTTKELDKGTGLGLSTVMAIIKSHGGVVNVYSEPGKGTTFKVYLPAMEKSSEAEKDPSEEVSLPRGNGETVLLVDDEASILTITGQTLQAFGYRILTAINGAEAVAIYAQHRDQIAVVLTDMKMPVMDGLATIHALRRINPAVKIVAMSGLTENGGAGKVSGAGVKHFLTKPCTSEILLKTMRAILDEA
ncbi:MAG: PAS domain S-box protein [Methylacidiphilales bacterium]|nr:PAS domain S-box protein [Candidatus Methylacidiphilales bacterium]